MPILQPWGSVLSAAGCRPPDATRRKSFSGENSPPGPLCLGCAPAGAPGCEGRVDVPRSFQRFKAKLRSPRDPHPPRGLSLPTPSFPPDLAGHELLGLVSRLACGRVGKASGMLGSSLWMYDRGACTLGSRLGLQASMALYICMRIRQRIGAKVSQSRQRAPGQGTRAQPGCRRLMRVTRVWVRFLVRLRRFWASYWLLGTGILCTWLEGKKARGRPLAGSAGSSAAGSPGLVERPTPAGPQRPSS